MPTIHPGQEGKSPEVAALVAPVQKPARRPPKGRRAQGEVPAFTGRAQVKPLDDILKKKLPPHLHLVSHDGESKSKVIYDFRDDPHGVPEVRGAVRCSGFRLPFYHLPQLAVAE